MKCGKKFYQKILSDPDPERNFCVYMQALMESGSCASLVNDDNGHWAIADDGIQNLPTSDATFDLSSTFIISKDDFASSIGEALRIYARKCLH